MSVHFTLKDQSQRWYELILADHVEEAQTKVASLLADTTLDDRGCMVTATTGPQIIRFHGRSDRAYRFVLSVQSNYAPSTSELVCHQCHNRRCINPAHLRFGSRLDNWLDEVDRRANGVGLNRL